MRRNAILLVVIMFVQVTLPMQAGASTSPPTGPGDWTISSSETAYLNSSDQALVQGHVKVYGTLIINGGSLFLWGSSDGLRDLVVYDGGRLVLQNGGVLSSYTSVCFDMDVQAGASLDINDGRIQEACFVQLMSTNWSLQDAHFEDSILRVIPPSSPNTASNGTPSLNWTVDGVDFANITRGPVVQLQQGGIGSWSTTAKALPMAFKNFTVEVDMYDQGSNPSYHTIEVDWRLSTYFTNGHVVDQSYANSTSYSRYKDFGSQTSGNSYALYPALFDFSTSSPWGGPHSFTNVTANHSHEHAFLYARSQVELSNVHIDNLLHPIGDYTVMNPLYNSAGTNNIATAIIQSSSSITASNVTITNSAHIYDSNTNGNQDGVDVECFVFRVTNDLVAENLTVTDACVSETVYSLYYPFRYESSGSSTRTSGSYDRCDGLNPNSAYSSLHVLTTIGDSLSNPDSYCRLHSSFVAFVTGSVSFENIVVHDSAIVNVHFSYTSSSSSARRHATSLAAVLFSEGGGQVTNMDVLRSGNASTTSAYSYGNMHLNAFSYLVALEGGSTSVLYVNNSELNHSSVTPDCSDSYWDAQHWYAAGVGKGTVIVRDTNISEITLSSSCSSHGDAGMAWLSSNGEFLRKWTIDVRVVDPDGVFTPNATVKAYENSIWLLGNKSTGSNGSLVSFEGTQYSLTRSANYSYTPHRVEVTMTNYSNSTTFNMTGPMNITVFDPTPDAFPGDITQDWDNDSDGYGDNISGNNPDHFPNDSTQWNDTDGDGYGDNQNGNNPDRLPNDATQWNDTDGDGYGDNQSGNNPDRLPNDPTQWQDADGDGYGDNPNGNNPDAFTNAATQWSDADGDGYGDNASGNNPDAFTTDATQWSDTDGDGYGDNASGTNGDAFPLDSTQHEDLDGDGLGDNQSGNNPDPYLNDSDNDGYNNSVDQFPWNPTQHEDLDGDGLGDNTTGTAADPYPNDTDNDGTNNSVDPFPTDATQDTDADGDGYGDNQSGNNPDPYLNDSDNDGTNNDNDDFPWNPTQTTDSDGDGWGDNASGHPADAFPNEASQWKDSDGDGYGDNPNGVNGDAFPYDSTQWSDADGDGYGDNPNGTLPDAYPYDASQWADSDGDGYGDNYTHSTNATTGLRDQNGDAFPNDATQWSDLDGDGHGDNASGTNADEYPYDSTQWRDADGDTFPDNYSYSTNQTTGLREGQVGDAFPNDATQWSDKDGDGYGDNPNGNNPDAFPNDPTQWADADNDGLGDNPDGNNPDPTPGDTDNDGVPDYQDAFPNEPTQWADSDGDGYGDNWGATEWTTLRPSSWPGRFIQNAALVDYFPTIAAAHEDSDFDGFPDDWGSQDTGNNRAGLVLDACPLIFGNATTAGPGCPDGDGDNVADQDDAFPLDPSQWADADGDGYGDNQEGSFPDRFPSDPSQCCDRDGDGYGDNASGEGHDAFLDDPTQWADADGDGHGDNPSGSNADLFPDDPTQWQDADGDGLGDDPNGSNPDPYPYDGDNDAYPDEQDDCPSVAGNSSYDRKGCLDSDGDGVSDAVDLWPTDPSRSLDTDGDGVNDPDDAFVDDPTQWVDNDNDGLGDNPHGNNPDPYLDDSDNDGVINQNDAFPYDPTQFRDLDGDGYGDNVSGNNPDFFPNDTDNDGVPNPEDLYPLNPDQSSDSDGDGWGDNPNGSDGDIYPLDPTQCCDTDGDGWGDNPNGTMPDAFPLDPTQWMDADRDGLGDNPNGANPDPYPNDTDNDGVPNGEDGWPNDPTKYLDSDGDGIEDGDENFLTSRIPQTSTEAVMGLVLFVSLFAAAGGYFMGQRQNKDRGAAPSWGLSTEEESSDMADDEI